MGNIRGGMNGFLGTIGQPTAQVIDSSLKFKGGQYLERTSTAGNQTTWTWSGWIKTSDLSGNNIFGEDGGYPNASASFNTSGQLRFTAAAADSSVFLNIIPSALFRDLSAWYHFVIVYDSGNAVASERARVYVNGSRITDLSTATYPSQSATTVVNSNGNAFRIGSHSGVDHLQGYMSQCYFIDGLVLGPGYFGFTDPLTNTWRPRKFRAEGTTVNDGTQWSSYLSNSTGAANLFDGNTSTAYGPDGNTQTFTPPNPIIVKNSLRIYYSSGVASRNFEVNDNGNVVATGTGTKWVDLNFTGPLTKISGTNGWNVRAIEVDGVIMQDSTTTNLSFGTNGFYLPMDDEDRFRLDQSGNNNHFTESGWSGTSIDPDVVKDSPSGAVFGGRGQTGITTTSSAPTNYCTWNPLWSVTNSAGSNSTFTNASLTGTTSNSATSGGLGSIGVSSGKWYFEITSGAYTGGTGLQVGVAKENLQSTISSSEGGGSSADGYFYYNDGRKVNNNSASSYGATYSDGDVISVLLNLDAGSISFHKNGADQGTAYTGLSGVYYPAFSDYNNSGTSACTLNCGQKPFKYAPPQGYLPINSATVRPNKVITRPDQYVGVATYRGTGANQQINVVSKPDLVIVKGRDGDYDFVWQDTVRGLNKTLSSNRNNAETTDNDGILSVNTKGFVVGENSAGFQSDELNKSGKNYVTYCFNAGGNKNTFNVDGVGYASAAAAGLTGGDITPTGASVGTKQGFSIITWDTASLSGTKSIDTGLTQAPEFVITKVTTTTDDWLTFHKDLSSTETFILNGNRAKLANAAYAHTFNSDGTIGGLVVGDPYWWMSNETYVFYSWHSVPGLQKFGSYVGNNNAEGPFVELGFRPAVLWVKRSGATGSWYALDIERDKFNNTFRTLSPNQYAQEDSTTGASGYCDFLSNGFKARIAEGSINASDTYMYAAWATAPASNLFGGQSNAR